MNTLLEQIKKKNAKVFTHSGKFHADDVFSSALLLYFNPEITITRGNKVPEDQLEDARLNYVSELVTLAVFGNFGPEFRSDVISQLRQNNVYQLNIDGISEDTIDGKKVLIYPVSVGLKSFTTALQKAFTQAGYGEFPPLDPANYTEDSRVNATFAVDPKNNSIAGIQFGSRAEQYSGYGIFINVTKPNVDFENGQLEEFVQQEIQTAL